MGTGIRSVKAIQKMSCIFWTKYCNYFIRIHIVVKSNSSIYVYILSLMFSILSIKGRHIVISRIFTLRGIFIGQDGRRVRRLFSVEEGVVLASGGRLKAKLVGAGRSRMS